MRYISVARQEKTDRYLGHVGYVIFATAFLTLYIHCFDENAADFQRNFELHSSVLHFVKYLHAGGPAGRRMEGGKRTYSFKAECSLRKWDTYSIQEVNLGCLPQT